MGSVEISSTPIDGLDSDYGTDLDDDAWDDVLSQTESQPLGLKIADDSIVEPVLPDDDRQPPPSSLRLARIRKNLEEAISGLDQISADIARHGLKRTRSVEIEYDQTNRGSFAAVQGESQQDERREREQTPLPDTNEADARSPLERFRTRKPLSVTDLVAPAWCELQYWYSLTKYGRVRRTRAMKQGSKIHKEKEREVHVEVPVQITTKEDQVGLRMWNIIQGLRTLRSTGLTRELEVFGMVDGEVIIGIIDELSYNCPDEDLEQSILEKDLDKPGGKKNSKSAIPADQRTMTDFFGGSQGDSEAQAPFCASKPPETIYLADIKTRVSKSLPKLGSQMRATQMQLMMYRRLLNDLAANNVEAERVFERYNVDGNRPFSDSFIAQLAGFDLSPSALEADDADDEPGGSGNPEDGSLDEILSHNTLTSLWSHMIAEFTRTISVTPTSSSISPLLTAEFRSSNDGDLMGRRSFAFDAQILETYVQNVMKWWRGEREPCGVEIEEVYKCKSCDFLDSCQWRKDKAEEMVQKARLKNAKNGKSRSQV